MRRFDAVIFDMDGTLIEPLLDFPRIRARLGIGPKDDVLASIAAMPLQRQAEANRWLEDYEFALAQRAVLLPGAAEAVWDVRRAGMKTALLTRNDRRAMRAVIEKFEGLEFDLAWSRQDGPYKPEPHGVVEVCRRLAVAPGRAACVGDYHYDVLAANAAGAVSVLFARNGRPPYAAEAAHVISCLSELPGILGL